MRLFRHHVAIPGLSLAFVETVLFFCLLYTLVRFNLGPADVRPVDVAGLAESGQSADLILLLLVTLVTCVTMISVGLYNRKIFFHAHSGVARAAVTFPLILVLVLGLLNLVEILAQADYQAYYAVCAVAIVMQFPLILVVRRLFVAAVSTDLFQKRVLVIGAGPQAAKLMGLAEQNDNGHFKLVGILRMGDEAVDNRVAPTLPEEMLHKRHALSSFVRDSGVDEIVVATREKRGLPVRHLLECRFLGVRVTDYATFWERESGQVDLQELQPSWLIFSDGFRANGWRDFVKRLFDVVLSVVFLLFTLPLTLVTALAVKLDSPGPALYRQERVGRHGRRFHVLKFRSMGQDAEKDGVPRWAGTADDRVTAVGRFIRKTRIDEIPQVLNVLMGDMSFVGPRPERPYFVDQLCERIPYFYQRHQVKPGITGWAQINHDYGASEEDAKAKLAYDLYYVKNNSLFLDFVVVLQTVRVVLWTEGAR